MKDCSENPYKKDNTNIKPTGASIVQGLVMDPKLIDPALLVKLRQPTFYPDGLWMADGLNEVESAAQNIQLDHTEHATSVMRPLSLLALSISGWQTQAPRTIWHLI